MKIFEIFLNDDRQVDIIVFKQNKKLKRIVVYDSGHVSCVCFQYKILNIVNFCVETCVTNFNDVVVRLFPFWLRKKANRTLNCGLDHRRFYF